MTFGDVETLYMNLRDTSDKLTICRHFGVKQTYTFENYIDTIRFIRNTCAHGGILFDLHLPKSIKNGPAGTLARVNGNNLSGALQVVDFFIGQISVNRQKEMQLAITDAIKRLLLKYPELETTLKKTAGILQYQK